jgi:uncharacterized protein (TIGR04552 family)
VEPIRREESVHKAKRHDDESSQAAALKLKMSDRWRMPWQEFEVCLGVKNAFGLRNLNIHTHDRAGDFLKVCGFDVSRSDHLKGFEQFFLEALFFIRHTLLDEEESLKFKVPAEILQLDDPRKLLVMASNRNPRRRYVRLWACALLKVVYAIANVEYSGRLRDLEFARDHILGRIRSLLFYEGNEIVLRFRDEKVRLRAVDWKEAKSRTSIVLKLLHKPDSIVDEVSDYLGVRFVAPTEADVAAILKMLIEADVIIPHQVVGLRTRNSLFNYAKARKLLEISQDLFSMGSVSPEEFEEMCSRIPWSFGSNEEVPKRFNAFSSSLYRSLQLTVRHLVRTPNPAWVVVDSLSRQIRHYRGIERDDPYLSELVPPEISRYFPVEIQIMDSSSYDLSKFGPASHEQYKASQLKAVRERVLGSMLYMTEYKMATQEF